MYFETIVLMPKLETAESTLATFQSLLAPYDLTIKSTPWIDDCRCKTRIDDDFEMTQVEPDPECPACKGKGYVITDINPNGHYDFWDIPGFIGEQHWSQDDLDTDDELELITQSTNSVPELLKIADVQGYDFCVVTPDGEWHSTNHPDNIDRWAFEARHLLESHRDCVAISCKMHY